MKNQKRPKKGHSNHYLDKNNRGLFKKQIKAKILNYLHLNPQDTCFHNINIRTNHKNFIY